MKRIFSIFFIFIIASIAILIGAYYFLQKDLNSKADYNAPLKFEIPKGTSIQGALKILNRKGVLKPYNLYRYYLKYYTKINSGSLYAGIYLIDTGKTNIEIIDALFDKSSLWTKKVTFPEGLSFKRYAEIAFEKLKTNQKEFLRLCRSDSLLKARNIKAKSVEGYLMPDTYEFFMESAPNIIIDRMLDNHYKFISKYENKIKDIGFEHHKITTLASIIEAETPVKDEKSVVSGLYHNRLKLGWMLQADPTVQYAIGEKRRVLYDDLKINHPYNTYKIIGLPPGPINNPGKDALYAAIFPDKHDFLYMVAVGDGSGKHNFGTNFSQHQQNIRIFKRNAR